MKLAPRDGGFALCVIGHSGWKQHYLESFREHFFLFQVKFPKYCSSISQAGAFLALFSFQREMVCLRLFPQHGLLSFSCWDVLARSSPLVYWLQTICDCRGLWLLSLQKQEVQSIHERHRTFFFFLLKNVYFCPLFWGPRLKRAFWKEFIIECPASLFFSNKNIESGQCELSLNSSSLKEIRWLYIAVLQTDTLWNNWGFGLAIPTGWWMSSLW